LERRYSVLHNSLLGKLRSRYQASDTEAGLQLSYLLDWRGAALMLQAVLMRVVAGGHIESVQPYPVQGSHLQQRPTFIRDEDLPVLQCLLARQKAPGDADWVAVDPALESYLEPLCRRQCLRVARAPWPLWKWLPPQAPQARWQRDCDFVQRLQWALPADGEAGLFHQVYLRRDPPALGCLDLSRSVALRDWVARAVQLAPDQIPAFLAEHGAQLQAQGWPLPASLDYTALSVPPRPVLLLRAEAGQDGGVLAFSYGTEGDAWLVEADAPTTGQFRQVAGELRLLERDFAAESRHLRSFVEKMQPFKPNWLEPEIAGQPLCRWRLARQLAWRAWFLEFLPSWRAGGGVVQIAPGFGSRYATLSDLQIRLHQSDTGWFDLAPQVWIDGQAVAFIPLLIQAARQWSLAQLSQLQPAGPNPAEPVAVVLEDGCRVLISAQRLYRWLSVLIELYDGEGDAVADEMSAWRLPASQISRLAALGEPESAWAAAPSDWRRIQEVSARSALAPAVLPACFNAQLRDYQQLGVAWLQQRVRMQCGGILADDMGLGKTLQTLTLLASLRPMTPDVTEPEGAALPSLVVVPASLTGNWYREAAQFVPRLRCFIAVGPKRVEGLADLSNWDLIITSYGTLLSDAEFWAQQPLNVIVLDEAQQIRNPDTRISRCVRQLHGNCRLALTGTPLENRPQELWSLLDWVLPGVLGSRAAFARQYGKAIEAGDARVTQALLDRIAPFLLRRRKQEVAQDLPACTEMVVRIPLAPAQAELYQTLRARLLSRLRESAGDTPAKPLAVIQVLLQLRLLCCDPSLVCGLPELRDQALATPVEEGMDALDTPHPSAKRQYCLEMIQELVSEGRVILVFSQFTRMLDLLAQDLRTAQIDFLELTGKTRNRAELVSRFQNGAASVFLISLKAGGTGLNLTRADTVIHYDPWWNNAAIRQASDRAHRIGQQRAVFVYRLIAEETVEEKLLELQQHKQSMLDAVYQAAEGQAQQMGMNYRVLMEWLGG
jgi:superfamily II DNA or RNA helicase